MHAGPSDESATQRLRYPYLNNFLAPIHLSTWLSFRSLDQLTNALARSSPRHVLACRTLVRAQLLQWDEVIAEAEEVLAARVLI